MLFNLNIFFNVLFTLEFMLKVISKGFILTDNAYIWKRDNFIDFVVLVSTWSSIFAGPSNSLIWLRVFRFIRPLQLLSKSKSQRVQDIFNAIIASIPSLLKLVIIWFVFMIVFGASAMLLFQGKLYRCNDTSIQDQSDCKGIYMNELGVFVPRKFSHPGFHFDDLLNSIMTLFAVSSTEGWLTVLHDTMSFTEYGKGGEPWNHPEYAIFFIIFITLFSFFLFDVSVGIIVEKTREIRGDALLTSKQKVYRYLEAIVSDLKPPTKKQVPSSKVGRYLYELFGGFRKQSRRSHVFNVCMGVIIICHSALMSVQFYAQPRMLTLSIIVLNALFNMFYVVEVALKLIVVSPERYFRKKQFVYEFIVMIFGIVSCLMDAATYIKYFTVLGAVQVLVYVARLAIVLRMLRLIKFFAFSVISRVLMVSLPYIASLCATLFVFLLLFAVAGVDLFGKTKYGVALNPDANFQTTYNAMLLLFRSITGENWPLVMQDCAIRYPLCDPSMDDCGSAVSPLYFITFQVVGANIILSFIIAGIVDNFEWILAKESSFLSRGIIRHYNSVWKKFDTTLHCPKGRLPIYQLKSFLVILGNPLGIETSCTNMSENDDQSPARRDNTNTVETNDSNLNHKMITIRSKEARWKYYMIRYEVQSHSVPYTNQQGDIIRTIDYNKLLLILLRHMINIDGLNYQERNRRKQDLEIMKEEINKEIVKSFLLMCHHKRLFRKQREEQQQRLLTSQSPPHDDDSDCDIRVDEK